MEAQRILKFITTCEMLAIVSSQLLDTRNVVFTGLPRGGQLGQLAQNPTLLGARGGPHSYIFNKR